MEDRAKFIREWRKNQWSIVELCRRFQISRPTAYKVIDRFESHGLRGLDDWSRAPHHQPNRISAAAEAAIVKIAREYRAWGPRKLRWILMRRHPRQAWPSITTIGDIRKRHGLAKLRRAKPSGLMSVTPGFIQPLEVSDPNDLWRTDFKGWRLSGDKQRCEPLAITDHVSRFGISCELVWLAFVRFASSLASRSKTAVTSASI